MELIKILQERCDIYSDLIENIVQTNIDAIKQTTDINTKKKLTELLISIEPNIKRIETLIDQQENIVSILNVD